MTDMHSTKGVTVLFIGVLTSAGMHLLRTIYAIQNWNWLQNILGWIIYYMLISGLTFFFLSLIILFLIIQRNQRIQKYFTAYIFLMICAYWFDRLVLSVGESHRNLAFVIGSQLIILLVYTILMRSKSVKAYFGEKHA
ncbi:MAG: hypothetical protein ACPL0B_03430 [Anaerolineales bacterium]